MKNKSHSSERFILSLVLAIALSWQVLICGAAEAATGQTVYGAESGSGYQSLDEDGNDPTTTHMTVAVAAAQGRWVNVTTDITTISAATASGADFEVKSGTFDMVFGGCSTDSAVEVKNNTVKISGGTLRYVFGGSHSHGNAAHNTVTINGGTVENGVYGGASEPENCTAIDNTVTINGGTVGGSVYGGYSPNQSAITGNTVTISGGEVTGNIYGGYVSRGSNEVSGNEVTISGGEVKNFVCGGCSFGKGDVTNNTVNISGGTVIGNVCGGISASGAVTSNSVNISGTAILTSATLKGYEGGARKISSHSNNTLTVASNWTGTIKSIQYFDSIVNDGDLTVTKGVSAIKTTGSTALPADLTFTNNNSFGGNLIKDSDSTLNFINNGTWYPKFDENDTSANSATAITLAQNGIINLNGKDSDGELSRTPRTLNITASSFTSNGGILMINTNIAKSQSDLIDMSTLTGDITGNARVAVAYDPCFKTGAGVAGSAVFLKVNSSSTLNVTGAGTSYNGLLYTPTVAFDETNKNWQITAITTAADETSKAVSDGVNVVNFVWLETVNNVQKRLGELRGGEESDMAWARFQRSNDDYDGARPFNVSGNMYQVGYDFALKNQVASRGYFGVSLERFDGTQSYKLGGGDVASTSLGAYYTKIYDSGHYFDFILRYGRLESDSTSYDSSLLIPVSTKLDYAMNSVTLSGEYGYRANLGKSGLYLEPQAEFIYGYLSGAKATSSTNILADIDSTNHFVTRLGLAFGQRVKNFNYYLRGSYYHDFAGTTHVKYGDASYKQDSAQNWWEISLGGGWNISKLSYFYAELTKHFKDVSNSLNFNLGFRFTL